MEDWDRSGREVPSVADFEETLNQILSSPQAMEQIMSLAGSLSGELGGQNAPAQGDGDAPQQAQGSGDGTIPQPVQGEGSPGLPAGFPALSGMDPALLGRFLPLVKVYQQGGDDKTRLLEAMRPFLKPERAGKLDQAIRITRLSRVIRAAMELLRGDGNV